MNILLISCKDKPGIVYKVGQFLYQHGANITLLDQHSTDPAGGQFFMRVEFQTTQFDLSEHQFIAVFNQQVAQQYEMQWSISRRDARKRMAIFVSKHDHALLEILWRYKQNELRLDIPVIISNHPDLAPVAAQFNLPYCHVDVNKDNKMAAEAEILRILRQHGPIDGIILARYMQILSDDFVKQFPHKIINIHHSFLPAFIGANPYQQAYDKGVKLIGATAHYVTAELDMGPIITQEVAPVSHRFNTQKLKQLGRDLERLVLAKAVELHLDERIIVHENKTIVFSGY